MKTKLMMVTGLLALVFCLPNASAQEEKKDKPKRKGPPSKEAILKKFDTNQDGALSKEELAEMPGRMSARLLGKWDTDPKDGALSKEEVDAIKFPERKPGDRPPRKKKDGGADGDGAKKKEKGKKKDKQEDADDE